MIDLCELITGDRVVPDLDVYHILIDAHVLQNGQDG